MRIEGRRIHIAGSANKDIPDNLLRYAHELIAALVRALSKEGATFVAGVGKEPLARPDDPSSPSLIFDWTVLNTAHKCLKDRVAFAQSSQARLITAVMTSKSERQIPEFRQPVWKELRAENAIKLEFIEPGWASGAFRRTRQVQLGDILIILSGGEGVEHLAQQYVAVGKPVIPFDLDLGSSRSDGSGGAARLAREALAHPERFVHLSDPDSSADLLARMTTHEGQAAVGDIVHAVVELIRALEPPSAFYVRLLNNTVPEYEAVERFFRHVIDPVVQNFGYKAVEIGRGANTYAWVNEAIFDSLHHSSVAVVDLTGLRNNCFMELGYALGRESRVILTAQKGTHIPFDSQAIDCHLWEDSSDNTQRISKFEEYWRRNIDRPPLVKPRRLL